MRSPWAAVAALLAAAYLALPAVWPQPGIEARFLEGGGDPEVVVTVRSWHSNVRLSRVGFCVELDKPDAEGQSFICPEPLYEGPDGGTGLVPVWRLKRLTFPRTRELRLQLPLGALKLDGAAPPGRLKGWVAVDVIHAKGGIKRPGVYLHYVEDLKTEKFPFELAPMGAAGTPPAP